MRKKHSTIGLALPGYSAAIVTLYVYGTLSLQGQTKPSIQQPGLTLLDAVQSAITHHPLLHIQEAQVEFSRGALDEASGVFDWYLQGGLTQQRTVIPEQVSERSFIPASWDDTAVELGATHLFRNGIAFNMSSQLGRTVIGQIVPGGENISNVALVFTIPLLRGRGRDVVAAQEDAARIGVEAETNTLREVVSQTIATAAVSYWNLVSAFEMLDEAKESEERGKSYTSNTHALIEADQVPRNDLNEATANLAQRSSARIVAEQSVSAARQQLALDMGLPASDIALAHSTPTDTFPIPDDGNDPSDDPGAVNFYLQEGLRRRGVYLALRNRQVQADLLQHASRDTLRPQLNLTLSTGYSGLSDGLSAGTFLASPFRNVPSPNAVAGITYSFPARNTFARGAVRQTEALANQAAFSVDQGARSISASIVVALQGVRHSRQQLREARHSVELYRASLSGAREKYAAGIGSLVEVLTIEDRLSSAQQDEIQAGGAYALALTQFRFATGTLIDPTSANQALTAETFRTPPFTGRPTLEKRDGL